MQRLKQEAQNRRRGASSNSSGPGGAVVKEVRGNEVSAVAHTAAKAAVDGRNNCRTSFFDHLARIDVSYRIY